MYSSNTTGIMKKFLRITTNFVNIHQSFLLYLSYSSIIIVPQPLVELGEGWPTWYFSLFFSSWSCAFLSLGRLYFIIRVLLSKIFKILITFSVWTNKVSCRVSPTKFFKIVPKSIPFRYLVGCRAFGNVQMGDNWTESRILFSLTGWKREG